MGRKKSYIDIVLRGTKKRHSVRTECSHVCPIINDNVRPNLYITNDNANVWSNLKPSDMVCIMTTQVQTLSWQYDIDMYWMFIYTEVMYEKKKDDHPVNGFSLFLNNIMIKEVFTRLLPLLLCSLTTNVRGCVPRKMRIIVWVQHQYSNCSSPICPLCSYFLICSKNHLFIIGIEPIWDKEL